MTDDQAIRSLRFMPAVRHELAQQGMTFTRSFVTTPQCCPSRASFFTGQYAHNHGVLSADPPDGGYQALTDKSNLLPTWLQAAGYTTGHVGKFLNGYGIASLGSSPTEVPPGWDYWRAPVDHTEYQMYGYTMNQDGVLHDYGNQPSDYQTDVIADKANRFIRDASGRRPFFLSVAPVAPHSEGVLDDRPGARRNPRPAPRDLGTFKDIPVPEPPSFGVPVKHAPSAIQRKIDRRADRSSAKSLKPAFLGRSESLLAVDDLVRRLVETLRKRGALDETYFIFTSDNGFLLGEHGLSGKVVPYEEATRVPLIIRGPGVTPGSSDGALVANIDLAPTITELANAQAGRKEDGRSLVPLLEGGEIPPRNLELEYLTGREGFRAVRTPRWTYARYITGGSELYDLRADPFQLHNLIKRPSLDRVIERLRRRLKALSHCSGALCR